MSNENEDSSGLRKKNEELLGEVKDYKGRCKRLEEEVVQERSKREEERNAYEGKLATLEGELVKLKLGGSAEGLLEEVSMPGQAESVRALMGVAGYRFALDDEGKPTILDQEGNVPTLPIDPKTPDKRRPVEFNGKDLGELLCNDGPHAPAFMSLIVGSRASGGGAMGSRPGGVSPASAPAAAAKPEAPTFGLK